MGALSNKVIIKAGESRETARRLGREQLRANFAASPLVRGLDKSALPMQATYNDPGLASES